MRILALSAKGFTGLEQFGPGLAQPHRAGADHIHGQLA